MLPSEFQKADDLKHIIQKTLILRLKKDKLDHRRPTLEFNILKSLDTLSKNPAFEKKEEKFTFAWTHLEVSFSACKITQHIFIFSIHTTGCSGEPDTSENLEEITEQRNPNQIKLQEEK